MAATLRRSRSSFDCNTRKRKHSSVAHKSTKSAVLLSDASNTSGKRSPSRPALTPIHQNLRPTRSASSRLTSTSSYISLASDRLLRRSRMAPEANVASGSYVSRKRKRSGNENYDIGTATGDSRRGYRSRDGVTTKRRKSVVTLHRPESRMDLDNSQTEESDSDNSVQTEQVQDTESDTEKEQMLEAKVYHRQDQDHQMGDGSTNDPSDQYLLYSAPRWQLRQLRKERLVQLYALLPHEDEDEIEDGGRLTKNELIQALHDARSDIAPVRSPPSSSFTDGNDAGAEESDAVTNVTYQTRLLRRRNTETANLGVGATPATRLLVKSRSLGFLGRTRSTSGRSGSASNISKEKGSHRARFAGDVKSPHHPQVLGRRSSTLVSYRSSPSSPPPSEASLTASAPRTTRSRSAGSGKGKHVEFSEADAEDSDAEHTPPQAHQDTDLDTEDGWEDDDDLSVVVQSSSTPRRATPKRKTRQMGKWATSPLGTAHEVSNRRGLKNIAELKKRVFQASPRKARATLRANIGDGTVGAASKLRLMSPIRTRRTRRSLARKVKTGESLRENSSSEDEDEDLVSVDGEENDDEVEDENDGEVEEENDDEVEEENDVEVEEENEEEVDGENEVDELMEESESQDQSFDQEESDLTPLEDEDQDDAIADEETDSDDNFGSQAEESPPPIVKALRSRGRNGSKILSSSSTATVTTPPRSRTTSSTGGYQVRRGRTRQPARTESPPEDADVDDSEEVQEESVDEEEQTIVLEPRVLRSGKIVGVETQEDQEDDQMAGTEEDDEIVDDSEDTADDPATMDEDQDELAEGDEGDSEEDYELSGATAKTLVRLRRDDLVRLCETRDLEVEGTKNQLVHNLLEWRDQQSDRPSSSTQPSSRASTARAPSTARPTRHGQSEPVLLRQNRVHVEQPRTPEPGEDDCNSIPVTVRKAGSGKDKEEELELDLESLGLEDKEIPADKLIKLEKIGSGGFKDVYIGKLRGRKIAIAEFRGTLSAMDIKELKLLRDFDHPNIVRFLGVSIPENTRDTPVMMISELCANGDLFDYIRNVPPPTLRKLLSLMLDVARGLEYLHLRKPSVIHRDCKSSNILITKQVTAKIADFGLAKVKQSTRSMVKSLVGTVNWQAPELWHAHPKYDHKVDVFSCAVVFWEMLQWYNPQKKYPWEGMNEHAIYEEVGAKKHRPSISGLRKQWCPEIVDLVEQMWSQDPHDRPTMSDVVDELDTIFKTL